MLAVALLGCEFPTWRSVACWDCLLEFLVLLPFGGMVDAMIGCVVLNDVLAPVLRF